MLVSDIGSLPVEVYETAELRTVRLPSPGDRRPDPGFGGATRATLDIWPPRRLAFRAICSVCRRVGITRRVVGSDDPRPSLSSQVCEHLSTIIHPVVLQ